MNKMSTVIKNLRSIALSTVLFFVAGAVSAQVIFTDAPPLAQRSTSGTQVPEFTIDFNKDGIVDFVILLQSTMLNTNVGNAFKNIAFYITPDFEKNAIAIEDTGAMDAIRFSTDESIDNSLLWSPGAILYQYFPEGSVKQNSGNFENSSGKYIGVKFMVDSNTYFGYIGVDVENNKDISYGYTIVNYAYESTPGKAIKAGAKVTGVISSSLKSSIAVRNINNTIVADFENSFNGKMEIINMSGQVVKTTSVNGNSSSVSMEGSPAGIYQVIISGAEGFATEKIFVADR